MSNPNLTITPEEAAAALAGARSVLLQLFDEGSFIEIDRLAMSGDGPCEAAAGYGQVDGRPVYAFAQDRAVCFGAIGKAQANKIGKIYRLAAQNGAPVVGVYDSDGARLGEKLDAMDAISELLTASNQISGVVPQIALVTGACIGSSAIIAANADALVTVGDADYYLNPGDARACGDVTADSVEDGIDTVKKLLSLLPSNNLDAPAAYDYTDAPADCSDASRIIEALADRDSAVVLFDGECRAALARMNGIVCGMAVAAGDRIDGVCAARLARFVRLCDSFTIPVVTFVDAAGFEDINGAAKLSHAYAETTAPKLTVITGRAYGAAYIALAGKSAGADAVLAWTKAAVLPLAPETAVPLLWGDRLAALEDPVAGRERLCAEYSAEEGCAALAAAGGHVTDLIDPSETKTRLTALLDMFAGKRVSRLPKKHSNILL